ncbi:MAG: hypothetical protein N2645_09175 [Clostridia bacterium]|nr:hypothetical protein [Clostridia bacterium]
MLKKTIVLIGLVFMLLAVAGCERRLMAGDVVVLPGHNPEISKSATVPEIQMSGPGSWNHSNGIAAVQDMRNTAGLGNASNFYYSPPGKVLDKLPQDVKWLDFEVADRFIYLIGCTGKLENGVEVGNEILMYDVDGQQPIKSMGEKGQKYVSMSYYNGLLYVYEIEKGELYVYMQDGSLKERVKLEKGLPCSKMVFSKNGWLLMMASYYGKSKILVYDNEFKQSGEINPSDLTEHMQLISLEDRKESPDIRDFDIYNEHSVLIKASPNRLLLYNFKESKVVKISYLKDDAGLISFDSHVLYSTSEARLGIFANNINQVPYVGTPEALDRMLINSSFPWKIEDDALGEWRLRPIDLPVSGLNTVHQKIKCRGSFVYLLDYKMDSDGSLVIRVSK